MDELANSLLEYNEQLSVVNNALDVVNDEGERDPLLKLQSELQELIKLTQENLDAISTKQTSTSSELEAGTQPNSKNELDDEYALFMQEMADTGVYDTTNSEGKVDNTQQQDNDNSDIEEELSTLLGMKCAVYHTHKWGGQPSLHNAMVCSVVPRQDNDQFKDLQVQVLYTHPTHAEMLPCPFYLNGECRFNDEQCRYSHGCVKLLSDLKDSIEPDFESLKVGSRVLMKLKPAESEDTSLTKKSSEKYHLWHRAIVIHIEMEKKKCIVKLEHGVKTGEKRKSTTDEYHVSLEEIFPLNNDSDSDSESGDSLSDTEYPESKSLKSGITEENYNLLVERSLETAGPAMGEWERHTRGIGSKLMLAMGYVPGSGLGAAGVGRVQPVEARVLPVGKSLDHCMAITEKAAGQDPLKVEQRLKRLQKKEEERNKRAYEREKERERRNVFNFLNKTLGNKEDGAEPSTHGPSTNMKQSTNKDLNIEKFKIAEDTRKIERELSRLNSSLSRNAAGSDIHKNINLQIIEKNRELNALKSKEQQICKEQDHRKNKQNMVF